jgi:hypothetical protein
MRKVLGPLFCLVLAIVAAVPGPAAAQGVATQTFTTSQSEFTPGVKNQGWWSPTASNLDANDNYFVGRSSLGPPGSEQLHRNFFTFDLSSACRASSVTLQLTRFGQTGPLTYSLFEVSTPAATLNANTGTGQTIFDDLGTGTSFGSFPAPGGQEFDLLSFPLNAAGVAAFNAARGGFFSIGGWTPDLASSGESFLFGGSEVVFAGTQQLVVTCLPTTKDECKNGGWKSYGVFKNQGDCVSFVATEGKDPPDGPP